MNADATDVIQARSQTQATAECEESCPYCLGPETDCPGLAHETLVTQGKSARLSPTGYRLLSVR